jgi:tetratricopeptide (TPR) repeat protein
MRDQRLPHRILMTLAALAMISAAGYTADDKIPITTDSPEARKEFLAGRELFEQLKRAEAVPHFRKAVELDPEFALATAYLAITQGTAKGFFENIKRAVTLAAKASQGEQLLITSFQAGGVADAGQQGLALEKLVKLHPKDERALVQLATFRFIQQEYGGTISNCEAAVTVNPAFAPAYNMLGYGRRFAGDYAGAEVAYKKYIALIPDDPNPYDSYAELLMKTGRFDESIAQYRKALEADNSFANAHVGIATNLMYSGHHGDARKELEVYFKRARDDAERRQALFVTTLTYLDEGKPEAALLEADKQYALGEAIGDHAAMSGDFNLKGMIYFEQGDIEPAGKCFAKSKDVMSRSKLSAEVKEANHLGNEYNFGLVAMAKGDLEKARTHAAALAKGGEARKNKNLERLSHELLGRIALHSGDYQNAVRELEQATLQNPYNLYRMGQARAKLGQTDAARKLYQEAASFNSLPNLNFAFVRSKAKTALATL